VAMSEPEDDILDDSKTLPASVQSPFLDPTIIPPEPIKAFRELYDQHRESNRPEDHEKSIAAYESLAEDPDLLAQLQPIDFMMAMNSCRDRYRVIPRMRRMLDTAIASGHGNIPDFYHIVLKAYLRLSDFSSCKNLLHVMRQRKVKYNTATYHILLDICKHRKDLREAARVLEEMRRNHVEITSITYLIMITICARVRNPALALEYFNEMPLLNIEHDVTHYNALLNAYAHAKDLSGASRVTHMMEDDGVPMDEYTYTAMIKALWSSGRKEDAEALVKRLSTAGTHPNAKILAAIAVEPPEILIRCNKYGVKLSQHDFNMMIIHTLKKNKFSNVPELMEEMKKHGHRPNNLTFTAMIDADIKMGKYEEARDVFQAMKQANIQPDVIAYSAMISGALSQATVHESLTLLRAMIDDGLLPNLHTFNSLLSSSVGEIGIDGFKTIRQTMANLNVRPDQRSFNAFMSAYALGGDMDEMLRSLEDMRRCRVKPDALTYSILISGFLQNGDLRYAMEWYYKMMEGGFKPAVFVLNNLMAALHGSGQGQQVLVMWHEINRMGLRKDEQTFEIVLEACEKYGLDEARPQIEEELKTFLATRFFAQQHFKKD
jgi:pentatricopeptide repeat protein